MDFNMDSVSGSENLDLQDDTSVVYRQTTYKNKYFKSDWREYNLPEMLTEVMQREKLEAIDNRVRSFPRGQTPYFKFQNSLKPEAGWNKMFKNKLTNDKAGVVLKRSKTFLNPNQRMNLVVYTYPDIKKRRVGVYGLTTEQFKLLETIFIELHSDSTISSILLNGRAGSGKTYILKYLASLKIETLYTTTTKFLCENVGNLYSVNTITICKFLMDTLKLKYFQVSLLSDLMKHVPYSTWHNNSKSILKHILSHCGTPYARYLWRKVSITFLKSRRSNNVFFLDEYSLVHEGLLDFIYQVVKIIGILNRQKVVFILSGDSNQINPLFANRETTRFEILKRSCDTVIQFRQQKRVIDPAYNQFLERVLIEPDLSTFVRNRFERGDDPSIDYNYPIATVVEAPKLVVINVEKKRKADDEGCSCKALLDWFFENDVENIVKLMFFSYSNAELQYNNVSLALSIFNALKLYSGITPREYVQYQILRYHEHKVANTRYPVTDCEDGDKIPVLPLVRYFPYKLLTRYVEGVPRSTILHLLDWNSEECMMLHVESKRILKLPVMTFNTNLIKTHAMIGFPIQMYTSETFYSSQGLTLTRDILANLSGASRDEAYVIFSRVIQESSCKVIHVPWK